MIHITICIQKHVGKFIALQLEWENHQRRAHRRWERELGRRDVTDDMSEDLSEGEKGDVLGESVIIESPRKSFQRNSSHLEVWSDTNKEKKLYIVLIRYYSSIMPPVKLLLQSLHTETYISFPRSNSFFITNLIFSNLVGGPTIIQLVKCVFCSVTASTHLIITKLLLNFFILFNLYSLSLLSIQHCRV